MKQHLHEQHIALCHPLWLHARHGWIVSIWGLSLAQTGTISPFSAWPVATLPELGSTSGFWYTQLVVAPAIACSGSWAASAMKKRLAHGKKTWLLTTWIHDVSGRFRTYSISCCCPPFQQDFRDFSSNETGMTLWQRITSERPEIKMTSCGDFQCLIRSGTNSS